MKSAFPNTWTDYQEGGVKSDNGMTLRDYFAAKAMASLITFMPFHSGVHESYVNYTKVIAMRSYEHADAMLKEREK